MHSASTSPTARPARRGSACSASGSPARASVTTSRAERARQAGRATGRAASAAPPATASRQPVFPQRQSDVVVARDAGCGRCRPAAPCAPRCTRAVGHDAALDRSRRRHEQQVVDVAPVGPVLAERHQVDVAVDEHRRVVVRREPARDREAVPAGHHARGDGLAAADRDRRLDRRCRYPEHASGAIPLRGAQQRREARVELAQHRRGRRVSVEFEASARRAASPREIA